MSFWRTFGFTTISPVETILDRDHYTLEELLDEEELLQETKAQNKKLIPFLTKAETLEKLMHYITTEPDDISDPRRRLKYPFLSCEILGSDVWRISESIYENEFLLDKLYGFLDLPPPLNPLLATYVCRVASVLLTRKIPQTIKYLKQRDEIIDKFIRHLGSSAVMDLLLKLIACEDTSEGKGVLEWLCSENLISRLIGKFEPALGTEVHENAAQAIVDIICVSNSSNNNNGLCNGNNNNSSFRSPLIAQLESEETVNQLLSFILAEGATSTLVNGLTVVIELLKRNTIDNSVSQENYKQISDLPPLLRLLSEKFHHFTNILINPPLTEQQRINQRNRGDLESLGFYRLKVVEFIVAFVKTNYDVLGEVIITHNALSICLKLFFKFEYNNFLHSYVEQLIEIILKSNNQPLKLHLFEEANLIGLIVEASQANEVQNQSPKGFRKPFMGYITSISSHLLTVANQNKLVADKLNVNEEWKRYIDTAFKDIQQIQTRPLGGHKPLTFSDNINEEEEDMADTSAQAVFTQYLAQQGYAGTYQDVDDDYDDDENEAFDAENDFDQQIVLQNDEKASFQLVGDDDEDDDDEDRHHQDHHDENEDHHEAEQQQHHSISSDN
eukprot:TRINITY_DN3418_c1_g2_i1.p1 TRINITY_DN3418_c1_g2~~TRINITY_DN3418_c1_g2_i1.p1  ORF type:complete len:614 (-),score=156.00 TRINITY_DN3418_c1_g2_i1:215-2056(-)